MNTPCRVMLLVAAICCLPAGAQTLRLNADSYTDVPLLPFAAPPGVREAGRSPLAQAPSAQFPAGYVLRTGELISVELDHWARREGWQFIWHPSTSWRTLRATQFPQGDVAAAVASVIDILRDEGKPIRLRISDGNKVMEVMSTEVRHD